MKKEDIEWFFRGMLDEEINTLIELLKEELETRQIVEHIDKQVAAYDERRKPTPEEMDLITRGEFLKASALYSSRTNISILQADKIVKQIASYGTPYP